MVKKKSKQGQPGQWQWQSNADMMAMMKVMMTQMKSSPPAMTAKPEKIKGTQIKQVKGGAFVRVVNADGKEFPIEATKAVYKYLRSIGEEVSMPGPASKKGKKGKKEKKERTPEEELAHKLKMEEKHQQTIEKEGRVKVSDKYINGEIIQRGGHFFWVKADNPNAIPMNVKSKLQAMNEEARSKNEKFLGGSDDLAIFVRMADIATEGLPIKPGTKLKFKLYTDNKGVGGCEVREA
mmetsp:Transcript_17538/g.33078  ORF Transcript_17538/g.33078 Transcript_17538/m.33078 type:complete len:236 (-) Transcript_17538:91-798(-)